MMWHCNFRHTLSSFKICLAYYANTSKGSVENYYNLLNVKPTADQGEIKKAFLEKSKILHPDSSFHDGKDTHEEFVSLYKAYSILSKPELRKDYDIQLRQTGNWSNHHIPINNPNRSPHFKNPYTNYEFRKQTSESWTDYCRPNGQKRARYNMEENYDNTFWSNYWSFSRAHGGGGPQMAGHDLNDSEKILNKKKNFYYLIVSIICFCVIPVLPLFFSGTISSNLEQANKDYINWLISKWDDQMEADKQEESRSRGFRPYV